MEFDNTNNTVYLAIIDSSDVAIYETKELVNLGNINISSSNLIEFEFPATGKKSFTTNTADGSSYDFLKPTDDINNNDISGNEALYSDNNLFRLVINDKKIYLQCIPKIKNNITGTGGTYSGNNVAIAYPEKQFLYMKILVQKTYQMKLVNTDM